MVSIQQIGAKRYLKIHGLANPPRPLACGSKVGTYEGENGEMIMYAAFRDGGCDAYLDYYPDATAVHDEDDPISLAWACQPPFEHVGDGICTDGDPNHPVQFWFSRDGYTSEEGCSAECESLSWCSGFTIGLASNTGRCFLHFNGPAPAPPSPSSDGGWMLDNTWAS